MDSIEKCESKNGFTVGIDTKQGSATYHYPLEYWDLFNVKEFPDTPVKHVAVGTNEFDTCIFLDAYEEW